MVLAERYGNGNLIEVLNGVGKARDKVRRKEGRIYGDCGDMRDLRIAR